MKISFYLFILKENIVLEKIGCIDSNFGELIVYFIIIQPIDKMYFTIVI